MARRYSISEARSNLPSIVDLAEAGGEIELTRRGNPVAVVISLRKFEKFRGERTHFGDSYEGFLKAYQLHEVGLEGDFFDSVERGEMGRKVML